MHPQSETALLKQNINVRIYFLGEVPERLNGPVLKTGRALRLSWVQIPPSPKLSEAKRGENKSRNAVEAVKLRV